MKYLITTILFISLSISVQANPLDKQLQEIKDKKIKLNEMQVKKILETGIRERRQAEVMAALHTWLQQNLLEDQETTYLAASSAVQAGLWTKASLFYRRLLNNEKLQAGLASKAVPEFYRLLILGLKDTQSAYLFMRNQGTRLRGFGSVRKFDSWYLDQAFKRKDILAICDWLKAMAEDKAADNALRQRSMDRLLKTLKSSNSLEEDILKGLQAFAKSPSLSNAEKNQLLWFAEIHQLNIKVQGMVRSRKELKDGLFKDAAGLAAKLLKADPYEGSKIVIKGWMNYNEGHTPNFEKMVWAAADDKMPPILEALSKLTDSQIKDIFAMPVGHGRRQVGLLFNPTYGRMLLQQRPSLFTGLDAPDIPLFSKDLKADQIKKMAEALKNNPHTEAAVIRAIASGGKTFSKAADAFIKNESWRYAEKKYLSWALKRLLNAGLKQDTNMKSLQINLDRKIPDSLLKKANDKSSADQQMALFKEIVSHAESRRISVHDLRNMLERLARRMKDDAREAMLISLLKENKMDILNITLQTIRIGGNDRYGRLPQLRYSPSYDAAWERDNTTRLAGNLEKLTSYLQSQLEKELGSGKINNVHLGLWLRTAKKSDPKARAFLKKMMAAPAWKSLNAGYRDLATSPYHFGPMDVNSDFAGDRLYSRALLSLPDKPNAGQISKALDSVLQELKKAPGFPSIYGLEKVLPFPKVYEAKLKLILEDQFPLEKPDKGYLKLVHKIIAMADKKPETLASYAMPVWTVIYRHNDDRDSWDAATKVLKVIDKAIENKAISRAATLAKIGLYYNPEETRHNHERQNRQTLKRQYAKLSASLGIAEIPVKPNEVGYKIFKSQFEFVQENYDAAWELYLASSKDMPEILQKLRHDYCFWILNKHVANGDVKEVEDLVKNLTVWDRRGTANFSQSQKAELILAYADIAFYKRATGTARAWYRKVADTRAFEGTAQQYRAILGSIAVDRHEKNYNRALEELEKLMQVKDESLRIKIHFMKGQIYYDQEKYLDADNELAAVLRRNPKHADALLLKGKILNRKREFESATDLEIGIQRAQKIIMPGEVIKINLFDPSLNVTGVATSIEVEVRSSSGDVERILLRPLGDSKSRYRAEIPSKLGEAKAGDKVLQVLGRDTITYGYSKRFREKMKDLPQDKNDRIGIAADFKLYVSAGAFPPRDGERQLTVEELGLSTAQKALGSRQVRPGNPIYIRVIDADQSKTNSRDEINVEIKSSSGDEIKSFVLKETQPFSGEFEGQVPTSMGQAVAFASSMAPGREANMVISPNDYQGWMAAQKGFSTFTIDFNDRVPLQSMTIQCPPENAISKFVVQTSVNGKDWHTTGAYELPLKNWQGRPNIMSFSTYGGKSLSIKDGNNDELPSEWIKAMNRAACDPAIAFSADAVKNLSGNKLRSLDHPGYSQLFRYEAYFYLKESADMQFRLNNLPADNKLYFLIDGKVADGENKLLIDREFSAGMHKIEIWCHTNIGGFQKASLSYKLGNAEFKACPDAMFDPSTFPAAQQKELTTAGSIIKQEDGSFAVSFASGVQAQLVRILIGQHNGNAAAIKKITLKDLLGKKRLPVPSDYKNLRENQNLEVIPGDTLFVKYVDDRPATVQRDTGQKSLKVAFNTASINVYFVNYEIRRGQRELVREPVRRFKMNDNVAFFIDDPDMDVGPERDTIEFKVRTNDGRMHTLKAIETDVHSGLFLGKVFPVTGKPTRETEIQVNEGGSLTAIYRDQENLDPGIPTDRTVSIVHARYKKPEIGIYSAKATALNNEILVKRPENPRDIKRDIVTPRYRLGFDYLQGPALQEQTPKAIMNSSVRFDIVAPHLAFTQSSEIHAYVQTESGRKAAAKNDSKGPAGTFDINVPGTMKLTATPGRSKQGQYPAGYQPGTTSGISIKKSGLDEGRFHFAVNLSLGDIPQRSFANQAAEQLSKDLIPDALAVRPGDRIYIGFPWRDPDGKVQWHTLTVNLESHVFLDVMNKDFNETCQQRFVGEKIFVRVIAPGLDLSGGRDQVNVNLKAKTGASIALNLRETFEHTGVFKGNFKLTWASDTKTELSANKFFMDGLPVRYGDEIQISLMNAVPRDYRVNVNRGSDGLIEPFTKQYTDSAMAIRTNFTLAECFFELAKQHREMKHESLARREMAHAKKLLEEALATHRDPDQQAHAEYLLGNLAQEYADTAENPAIKKDGYKQALGRFAKIPEEYPDSLFAPKSQYKKALVYEKMSELDIAVEEYVKLAYKYPDDELIPKAMSRLGGYFQSRGITLKKEADPLEKKEDEDSKDLFIEKMKAAREDFARAATIFTKLNQRYPKHELAGLAGLRAGQNLMRVGDYDAAIKLFESIYDNEDYDARKIRAQAMYWTGISCEKAAAEADKGNWRARGQYMSTAFKIYNRTRFEFSDSKWAKHARGRLADKAFADMIEKDRSLREKHLEALKERK